LKFVLDVSNNDTIEYKTFVASGAVALIAKATEGTGFQDRAFAYHRQVATNARKPFGSYLFLHPDSNGNEATYYLDYARPKLGDLQPIIDAEVTILGIPDLARRARICARALEAKGYRPLLYASAGIWQQMIAAEPSLKRLRVWEAQYPGRFSRWFPRLATLRIKLRHGVSVVMWQWTDSYQVAGHHYDASALLTNIDNIRIGGSL
jgi:GH25 family lysozyme M1 (1,4-beta-N-acetylmuramidase)